jgi:hypothetical protein
VDLQRVAVEFESRVLNLFGGRLLTFDGGESGDERGLEGVEIQVGCERRVGIGGRIGVYDQLRAVALG